MVSTILFTMPALLVSVLALLLLVLAAALLLLLTARTGADFYKCAHYSYPYIRYHQRYHY
jgi:hypothetical protein